MKRKSLFIFIFLFCVIKTFATDNDNRNFADIAFDYLCESLNGLNKKDCRINAVTYKQLPNKNIVIDMSIIRTVKFKDELTATDGHYFTQANGIGPVTYSKTAYKIRNEDWNYKYIVFLRSDGTPLRYEKRPDYSNIETWNNNYWFFLGKRSYNLDVDYNVLDSIECRSMDGEPLWKVTDMIIFSILKTENNLYLAGGKIGYGISSVIRGYDIKTGKVISERNGNTGAYCLSIKESEDGIECVEYISNTNTRNNFLIPYEANDKAVHIRQLMSRYDKNKASDQVAIGERYLNGKGFDKDEKKAVEWFAKAAEQKNSGGMERLAYCYRNGIGIGMDKGKAVSYYEEAAKAGNNDAIAAVIKMYTDGEGIPCNMSRVYYWHEVLAFKGDKDAQRYVMANQNKGYEKAGISPETVHKLGRDAHKAKDYDWARFCYERGMLLGNKISQYYLGFMNMYAEGVEQNYAKAAEYWLELAEQGDAHAQFGLGLIYGLGDMKHGLSPDEKKEAYWYGMAAENGHPGAQYEMGLCYERGHGVKKNNKAAAAMYEKSALSGNQEAIKRTVYNYETGFGVKKDESVCLMWFKKMNLENQLEVAKQFDENPKIKCTVGIVLNMYEHIAKQNNYGAMKRFAELSVEYSSFNEAVNAINLLEGVKNVSYSIRNVDSYMLFGKLYEREGRISQAIECYSNSGTQEGRAKAEVLKRRR